jgi:long-subunit fatty acid transport protein
MQISRLRRCVSLGLALAGLASLAAAQDAYPYTPRFFPGLTGAGARAMGMGGAFIAAGDDATAGAWNPAGLALIERPEVAVSGQPSAAVTIDNPAFTYTYHRVDHLVVGHTRDETDVTRYDPFSRSLDSRSIDFASVAIPLRLGSTKLVSQISYRRAVDLGFDEAYTVSGQGEHRQTEICPWTCVPSASLDWRSQQSASTDGSGGIDLVTASVGVSLGAKVHLGLALNRWGGSPTSTNPGTTEFLYAQGRSLATSAYTRTEDFSGTSIHLGILVKPTPRISVGAIFQPRFGMNLKYTLVNDTEQSWNGQPNGTEHGAWIRDGTIDWPQAIGGGVAVRPTDALTLSADVAVTAWSKSEFTYTETYTGKSVSAQGQVRTFSYNTKIDPGPLWPSSYYPKAQDNSNPQQGDATQIRLGAEYVVKSPRLLALVGVPLRVGFIRDGQMTRNAPDPGKVVYTGVTAGLGLAWKRVALDFAWVHMSGKSTYGFEGQPVSNYACCTEQTSYRGEGDISFSSDRLFASTAVRF